MSRPLRIEFPDALYHVTARGNRRECIFDSDQDRRAFLTTLERVVIDEVQIPLAQRHPSPPPLAEIERQAQGRNAAITTAYATGGYSYQQIAKRFGIHFTTVGTIVRGNKQ